MKKENRIVSSREASMPKPAELLPLNRPDDESVRGRLIGANGSPGRNGHLPLPPALASGPDLPALLRALKRRWFLAFFLGTLLAAGAGVAAWYLLPIRYTAYSQLRIAMTPPWLVVRNADTPDGRGEFLTYLRTQAAWIKNYFVLGAALQREEVKYLRMVREQPEPLTWLADELKVDFQEGSEILTVSLIGTDPDEVVTLVKAVTQTYLDKIVNMEREQRRTRLTELNDIYGKSVEKLRVRRNSMRKLADTLGTSDSQALSQKQMNLLTYFGEKQRQLGQVETELMKAAARQQAYQAREKAVTEPAVTETMVAEALDGDLTGKQLVSRILRLKDIIAEYRHSAVQDNEPSLLRAQRQLAEAEKAIETRKAELRPELLERLRQKVRAESDTGLVQLNAEVAALTEQEKRLRAEVETLSKEADKIGTSSTELEMVRAEIQREDKVANRVGDEVDVLQIELRSQPRVTLSQEAAIQKKDIKRQLLAVILAPLAVLVGVCLFVAWWEFRARRIQSSEEVIKGLGMRVVGAVPALPRRVRSRPMTNGKETAGSSLLESIDGIRTVLLRDASVQETRVVMVTSAVSGEGKTTLASHLAGSLARSGRRSLLIDCDLRHPAVHQLFEVPLRPGFSEAVLGEMHIMEVTRTTAVNGLSVIPAGQWDREVMQIMTREEVLAIFEKLKGEYDFIVMDSHPVLAATDALVIGQYADAVLLSLLRDVSQTHRVFAACQRLATLGIRILGAVVNGTRPDDLLGASYPATASAKR
jgi:capsular exopolysaccharide synthesis family protein